MSVFGLAKGLGQSRQFRVASDKPSRRIRHRLQRIGSIVLADRHCPPPTPISTPTAGERNDHGTLTPHHSFRSKLGISLMPPQAPTRTVALRGSERRGMRLVIELAGHGEVPEGHVMFESTSRQ